LRSRPIVVLGVALSVTEALDRLVAQQRRSEEHLRATWTNLDEVLVDLQDDEVMRQAWA
jgi:hypothetical protein